MATIVNKWKREGAVLGGIVRLAPCLASQVMSGAMPCLYCVAISPERRTGID